MIKPFDYTNTTFGGTEYMGRGFELKIAPDVPKFSNYLSLIVPGNIPHPSTLFTTNKEIIMWLHNIPSQFAKDKLDILKHPEFIKRLKYVVVPSEKHKNILIKQLPILKEQVIVIPNAIEPLKQGPKKTTLKLIHTSSEDRGMNILLSALNYIDENFELDIYNGFNPDLDPDFITDTRVTFFGKTPKATVRKAISKAHIHAYPATYVETFCLSQVEAMSAGLLCVTSDLGALPEVSGGHTTIYPFTYNEVNHVKLFAEHLAQAIERIKKGEWDPTAQIEYVNSTYSWDAIKDRWLQLHELL
jgi:phosphatidylinositol glycan class A protein